MSMGTVNGADRAVQLPEASSASNAQVSDVDRLAAQQQERLAKRAEQPAAAKPEPAPAPAPQVLAHVTVTLFSNGQASVDAPLERPDLCLLASQTLVQVLLQHTASVAAARAVAQHKAQPFMKRMFGKPA